MDPIIDILICALFLFVVVGTKFNKWPLEQSKLLTGKPSDYIDSLRYSGFCLIYVLTYFVITVVLFTFPELMKLFPSLMVSYKLNTYIAFSVAIVTISALPPVSRYDEQWRKKLHGWARIPNSVKEVAKEIHRKNVFLPTENYLFEFEKQIIKKDDQSKWMGFINNLATEKENHTIHWYYIKCSCLLLIVNDFCKGLSADDVKTQKSRIEELGRIVISSDFSENELLTYKNELEEMSVYFIECLCKHFTKKYPREDAKYNAFKNLGFKLGMHDNAEFRIKDTVLWCFISVVFVSIFSVLALLSVLDYYQPGYFQIQDNFSSWTIGSIVSFSIAIFVGFLVQKIPSRQLRAGIYYYSTTLLLATLASFIYLVIVRDVTSITEGKPFARILLAMSFSTVSIVVLKALNNASHDKRDVINSSLFYGLVLGGVMAVFQVLISIAFGWGKPQESGSIMSLYFGNWKLVMLFSVGLLKGMFIGGGISYFIQKIQREQLLEALRKSPRVNKIMVMHLKTGKEKFNINMRNISTKGAKIQSRAKLISGDSVEIISPVLGSVKGVIKWTHHQLLGQQVAGIEFTNTPRTLKKYIRENFGEYYA